MRAVEGKESLLEELCSLLRVGAHHLLSLTDLAASLGEELCSLLALYLIEFLDERLVFLIHLVVALGHWSRDDQRCAGIVDEHRVDLVDDGVVVLALHEVGGAYSHIVAEVVETEFVVCSEGDIGLISLAALLRVRAVLVDAVDAEAVELVERSHPLGVTFGQIVVDGDDVYSVACERVKEYRQCSNEGLTLTGSHLCNLSLMEDDTTEELYVVVDHLPCEVVAAGSPVIMVHGLVVANLDEVVLRVGCELTVEVGSRDDGLLVLRESPCRALDDGEGYRQHLVERVLIFCELLVVELVYLREDFLALVDRCLLDFRTEVGLLLAQLLAGVLHLLLYLLGLGAEFVVAEFVDFVVCGLDFLDHGLYLLHVPCRLVAEEGFKYLIEIHNLLKIVLFVLYIIMCKL